MNAVFRHELSSWRTNVVAYVFVAFLLLFGGIYTMVMCLRGGYANYEYVFYNMTFVYIITVPILTMRVISEERRQKTDQLLYSLPISMTKVALGKYFAMLVVLAIPVAILCVYPLVLRAFGNVYLPEAFSTALAFFLLGATLLAIGMFISSVTESQPAAAGLSFIVMLLLYFLTSLTEYIPTSAGASMVAYMITWLVLCLIIWAMTKNLFISAVLFIVGEVALLICANLFMSSFYNSFPTILAAISPFDRFYTFVTGVFDLTGIVYYITVIALFLYLSIQSLEKRRWS